MGMMVRLWGATALVTVAMCVVVLLAGEQGAMHRAVVLESGGEPIQKNQLLSVEVPASQLASTNIGDIIHGKVRTQGLGMVSFTGAVTAGTEVSATRGAVTVKVLSDKYISPGTDVSGRVGDSMFSGTVVNAAGTQERLGNMETRVGALEAPAKKQVDDIKTEIGDLNGRLRDMEGGTTMEERVDYLEKRIKELETRPPAFNSAFIKNNEEGFHFHGAVGPNTLEPKLDTVEQSIAQMEHQPSEKDVIDPVRSRLDDVSRRLDEITDGLTPRKTMGELEKRAIALEHNAAKPE
ncbi:hypothetical protein T484DRAFT_2125376 [Baffinella frigidus]|nr:hypothetical protein T484DRAFT_2125376 [Cryptophyta sp. CCMP2293]